MDEDLMKKIEIAKHLASLPDAYLLNMVETIDQARQWLISKNYQLLISLAWKAKHTGQEDPLRFLLDAGMVDKQTYNSVWLMVDFYGALWELIQVSFVFIKPTLRRKIGDECDSALELFCFIVSSMVNEGFSACLKPYAEISSRKLVKEYRLSVKAYKGELSPAVQKRVTEKGKRNKSDIVALVTEICRVKGKAEPVIKARLEVFYLTALHLGDQVAKNCWNDPSFAWVKGEKVKGQANGAYNANT